MAIHTSYIKIVFQEPPIRTESEVRERAQTLAAVSSSSSEAPIIVAADLLTIGGLAFIHIA